MMKLALISLLTATGLVAACTESGANYTPVLDGAPATSYKVDLASCQALARDQRQFDQETAGAVALGAGAGAVLGELDDEADAAGGAIAGALAGGAAGAVNAKNRRQNIVIECLRSRGHAVVG